MRINLTLPLKWAQWWAYGLVVVLVNLLFIFPLSAFLFRDFYTRMVPPDTVQIIPFSEAKRCLSAACNDQNTFRFDIKRYSNDDSKLPSSAHNGFGQSIPLRSDIPYKMDLKLDVFCLNKVTDLSIRDSEVTIAVSTSRKPGEIVIYRKMLLLTCANTRDTHSLSETKRLTSTFAKQVQDELVNSFYLENPVIIDHDIKSLRVVLTLAGNAKVIIDPNSSELKFAMNFELSLRNLMIKWKKLTYCIGTLLFNAFISFFFLIAFAISFLRAGHVRGNEKLQ